jgi:hypothetical protein
MDDDTRKLPKMFGMAATDACPERAGLAGLAGAGKRFTFFADPDGLPLDLFADFRGGATCLVCTQFLG